MHYFVRVVPLTVFLCLFLIGCSGNVRAPVVSGSEKIPASRKEAPATVSSKSDVSVQTRVRQHTVVRGDTLYFIAFNYGLDYRDVAAWNGIRAPYTIYPGQKLKLTPAAHGKSPQIAQKKPVPPQSKQTKPGPQNKAQPLIPGPIVSRETENVPEAKSETRTLVTAKQPPASPQPQAAVAPESRTTAVTEDKTPVISGPIKWLWPTQGKIVNSDTPISKNGIDIAGIKGQPVNASAPGQVVYSGSGLLGYGRLIIIKHNENYLSAYAHNDALLVKEGNQVTAGQNIALMGQTVNGRTLLHFEIRKNGQPVNPLGYLPKP
jgi:lipoprotein NlpD